MLQVFIYSSFIKKKFFMSEIERKKNILGELFVMYETKWTTHFRINLFFKFEWSFCACETGRRTLEEIYSCVKPSANIFRKNFFFVDIFQI